MSTKQRTGSDTPVARHQDNHKSIIWTAEISQKFYGNVNAFSRKLAQGQPVQVPENYRLKGRDGRANPEDYTLSYGEELHLADHFAFLAHFAEGVQFVSAVAVEESRNPPAFILRLASNHTPTTELKNGLERILHLVSEHARQGRHGDEYKTRIFDEVVKISQKRIYARLRCSRWEKPAYLRGSRHTSLSSKIETLLLKLGSRDSSMNAALADLVEAIKMVDQGSPEDQTELVKEVIRKSQIVSRHGNYKSFETALQAMSFGEGIVESREVLEIDKLGKYLEICEELVRLSRQPSTRAFCQGLKLEVLKSYPGSEPLGSPAKCYVHGEIQLVLFYEQYPKHPPPRAIGSSKSACFLCDLFIKKHGKFGISYSHMILYHLWTIPDAPWMESQQIGHFQGIIRAMTLEVERLLMKPISYHKAVIESRAHLLQIVQIVQIASSIASPAHSELQNGHGTENKIPDVDLTAPVATPALTRMESTLHYFQDLPISLDILPSTISCTLLAGEVEYIFDLEDVEHGRLVVSERRKEATTLNYLRINVRSLSSEVECIKSKGASETVTFHVHDAEKHELRMTMIWHPLST